MVFISAFGVKGCARWVFIGYIVWGKCSIAHIPVRFALSCRVAQALLLNL